MNTVFHFAFNVNCLEQASEFYVGTLGCTEGRRAPTWVDINFFGHQLSLHLGEPFKSAYTGLVDEVKVPMPHFGAILSMDLWRSLASRLEANSVNFLIPPTVRFEGMSGEQSTMFFLDPFGNPIELKGVHSHTRIFEL